MGRRELSSLQVDKIVRQSNETVSIKIDILENNFKGLTKKEVKGSPPKTNAKNLETKITKSFDKIQFETLSDLRKSNDFGHLFENSPRETEDQLTGQNDEAVDIE